MGTAGLGRFFAFCDRAFCIGAASSAVVDADRDIAGERARARSRGDGDALGERRPGVGLPLAESNPMGAVVALGGRAGGPERSAIGPKKTKTSCNTHAAQRSPLLMHQAPAGCQIRTTKETFYSLLSRANAGKAHGDVCAQRGYGMVVVVPVGDSSW